MTTSWRQAGSNASGVDCEGTRLRESSPRSDQSPAWSCQLVGCLMGRTSSTRVFQGPGPLKVIEARCLRSSGVVIGKGTSTLLRAPPTTLPRDPPCVSVRLDPLLPSTPTSILRVPSFTLQSVSASRCDSVQRVLLSCNLHFRPQLCSEDSLERLASLLKTFVSALLGCRYSRQELYHVWTLREAGLPHYSIYIIDTLVILVDIVQLLYCT